MLQPSTLPIPLPPDGHCQVFLDTRPDGCTMLAQVRLGSSVVLDGEALTDIGLADHDRQLLEGTLRRVDQFLDRVARQCHLAVLINDELRDENQRLRAALEDCVTACAPLLDRVEQSCFEGAEADQARAWLAIEAARQTLGTPPGLPCRAELP